MNDSPDPRLRRHPLGFLELKDVPTPEELQDYYAQKYYQTDRGSYRKEYSKLELEFVNLKIERRAACAEDHVRSDNDSGCPTLLDVGCGEGFTLAWYKERGWCVEGIDFSKAGIEAHNPSVLADFHEGDIFELLQQRIRAWIKYDLVWLQNVLEHVVDPVRLLVDLRRIVKSTGGALIVTVPNDGSRFQKMLIEEQLISEPFWIAVPDHVSYFTASSLRNISSATGWLCKDILADFPIDWFLLHPQSNYVRDRAKGADAHKARMKMERLIHDATDDKGVNLYRSLAAAGLGRNLTAFLLPENG